MDCILPQSWKLCNSKLAVLALHSLTYEMYHGLILRYHSSSPNLSLPAGDDVAKNVEKSICHDRYKETLSLNIPSHMLGQEEP